MRIHRVRGRNLTEALRRARDVHGERAVVLSQEMLSGGGVTIAVAEPSGGDGGFPLRRPSTDPGLDEVRRRLRRYGATKALTERVVAATSRTGGQGMYALDAAARVIGRIFPVRRSSRRKGRTRVLVFVGSTGVGKTALLAKLARRLVEADRRVVAASLDASALASPERAVQVGSVALDADHGAIPLRSVPSASDVTRWCGGLRRADIVLMDTPGLSPLDAPRLERIGLELRTLATLVDMEAYLVLPATASRATLDLAIRSFVPIGAHSVVITKIDETDRPIAVLERVLRARLPIAFLCNGQGLHGHLRRPRPDHLADLCLRGRIAA